MLTRLGNVIYWSACAIAALCATLGAASAINHAPEDLYWRGPVLLAFVAAALIWLAGRALRYVLGGH